MAIDDLIPEFKAKIIDLLARCNERGYVMKPYCTIRNPFDQAKLWRQSRTTKEIALKIQYLKNNSALFLAHCIESVGVQHGRQVTNAIPGLSWHQWGEAVDCYWAVGDKAEWVDTSGYSLYAQIAHSLNLHTVQGDFPHVQFRWLSPNDYFPIKEINDIMEAKFA